MMSGHVSSSASRRMTRRRGAKLNLLNRQALTLRFLGREAGMPDFETTALLQFLLDELCVQLPTDDEGTRTRVAARPAGGS